MMKRHAWHGLLIHDVLKDQCTQIGYMPLRPTLYFVLLQLVFLLCCLLLCFCLLHLMHA